MNVIEMLCRRELWDEFFEYKVKKGLIAKAEREALSDFIRQERYLPIARGILDGEEFPLPTVRKINKNHSDKKRVVFTFPKDENFFLKGMSYMLYEYDGHFSDNLYSFRRNTSVKHAINRIVKTPEIGRLYCYKVDIKDYFNSIPTDRMVAVLNKELAEEKSLVSFFEALLKEPCAIDEGGDRVECRKGIMAGVPISGFLANLYLASMDRRFNENRVLYARYSDDIIVFGKSEEEIERYRSLIAEFLAEAGLEINPKKEFLSRPGEVWEFLGFSYQKGEIDISRVAIAKLKAKMRRKARALLRWRNKTGAEPEWAARAFIRYFNRKLYDNPIHNDITWCRWYFPVITTGKSLAVLDEYMVACIRYIVTGKHSKANYNLRYETIKEYGFVSLVNRFYKTN